MSTTPISDWQLKLKRAQAHFDALRESVERFVNSDAYGFEITEPERGSEENTWVSRLLLRIHEQPPVDDWALMIGDIVHNVRSALDIMVYQLASSPDGGTAFPIHISEADFKARAPGRIKGLSDKRRALIEREQPYNRWQDSPASDPLAILADLDNTSKHRIIPAAISWFGVGALGFSQQDVAEIRLAFTGLQPPEDRAPLALVIFRVTGPDPKVEVETSKTANIIFGEGAKRAVEKPVHETIMAIGRRVKRLVSDFEQEA